MALYLTKHFDSLTLESNYICTYKFGSKRVIPIGYVQKGGELQCRM
jgi:hypothetical protein